MSSGQLVDEVTDPRECDAFTNEETGERCTFTGLVEVVIDAEVQSTGWTCPQCDTYHADEWGWWK